MRSETDDCGTRYHSSPLRTTSGMWHVMRIGALMLALCWCGPSVLDRAMTGDGAWVGRRAASADARAAELSEAEVGAANDRNDKTDNPADVETAESPATGEPTVGATAPSDGPNAEKTDVATTGTKTSAAKQKSAGHKRAKTGYAGKYHLQPNPLAGCTLCHVDVEDEFVGGKHFEESVGCKTCHGPSEGHLADENNEVKPNEVFARKDIDRLCSGCHECWREIPDGWAKQPKDHRQVCTECHGSHELIVERPEQSPPSNK